MRHCVLLLVRDRVSTLDPIPTVSIVSQPVHASAQASSSSARQVALVLKLSNGRVGCSPELGPGAAN
jgi:hypothetical protein